MRLPPSMHQAGVFPLTPDLLCRTCPNNKTTGSRICLGQNLAYAEIYAATAALVTRYDMQLFDTIRERDLDTVRDMFMALPSKESKGVRVKIQRRA